MSDYLPTTPATRLSVQLRTQWWRRLIPKIGRCWSSLQGERCVLRSGHRGWHTSRAPDLDYLD